MPPPVFPILSIGFTGTQLGMDRSQLAELEEYLQAAFAWCRAHGRTPVFRHGDCVGADDQAASTAAWIGFKVVAHPCDITSKRAWNPNNGSTRKPKPPLERNHDIVNESDYMVATPKEARTDSEPMRSGTWSTIRYARKVGKPIHIIYT